MARSWLSSTRSLEASSRRRWAFRASTGTGGGPVLETAALGPMSHVFDGPAASRSRSPCSNAVLELTRGIRSQLQGLIRWAPGFWGHAWGANVPRCKLQLAAGMGKSTHGLHPLLMLSWIVVRHGAGKTNAEMLQLMVTVPLVAAAWRAPTSSPCPWVCPTVYPATS